MGGLGSGEDGISPIPCGSGMENGKRHLSYTLWAGDGEWEDMAETILSYLLAELESSNPQRISKKMGGLGSGEDGISPIPCGSGMENGKTWPRPSYRIFSI
jgi:hypothetical protein